MEPFIWSDTITNLVEHVHRAATFAESGFVARENVPATRESLMIMARLYSALAEKLSDESLAKADAERN